MIYTTLQDDILDDIIFKYYNSQNDALLNLVISNNKELLKYPLKLPANLKIFLPDETGNKHQERLNLWD